MSVILPDVILRGTFSARPAASSAGSLYFASDTGKQYRDNGISWDEVTPPGGVQGPAGAVGAAGPAGPAGPAGQDGAPGVPGYSPNSLQAGGGVVWTSGLSFTVSPASYLIGNVAYTSPQTSVTLGTAHASLDRIDVIAVNSSGAAVVIAGTASSTPSMPAVDPSTQLQLSWAYIAASATTPSNITTDDVYHENTEWTSTKSGSNINLASTSSPIAGTVSVQATAAATGNYAQFQSPTAFDPATRNALKFTIQNQAAWPATRSLQIMLLNAGAQRGSIVVLSSGAFGFSTSDITNNQQVVIPIALFAASGLSVNQVRFTVSGTGTAMSYKLDDIILQAGVVPASAPTGMSWSGAWNATKTYPVNATVSYAGSSWVSMAANTNSAPTASNANWAQMTAPSRAFGATFSGAGSALTAGSVAGVSVIYIAPLPYACTAIAWSVTVDAGTAGFRIWRKAAGTAVPTVTDTITTADLAITTGTNLRSTTMTNFTGGVAPVFAVGDVIAVQLNAASTATVAIFSIQCQ